MIKKTSVSVAAVMMLAAPALAQEVPQATTPAYNCDFEPSCEVAPGIYGKMASPVTSKFNLSIGGFVKLDYAYNSVNLGSNGALGTLQNGIPKSSSAAGRQDQSIFTARQSRFWLKVAGPNFLGAKTNAIIEADFYGGGGSSNESPNMRLRLANTTLDWVNTQVLVGQAYDIFGPAISSTVDFGSGNKTGAPNNPRVPQVRVTQKVNLNSDNALRLVLGVQNPVQDANAQTGTNSDSWGGKLNVAGQAMLISKALGVAPGYYGLSMNSLTAGVFGLYGNQSVGDNSKTVDTWGYGFYTFVPLLSSKDGRNRAMTASFEGQLYMAANQSVNGATAGTVIGPAGSKTAAKGYGFYGQLIFYPTQDLGITAGYGRRNAYNYASYSGINNFEKSNSNIYANIAYDLNAAVRVAVEYQNLNTQYGNVTNGTGNLAGLATSGTANIARFAAFYFF
ncbi:hypothetical protein GeomeDRAFT_1143 [Geobacter metallireducens RCH3]|uniref:Outer membrane channel n=1 Tax=Geobacter metallireducens (strain ATCC 53774 / DSM 7210 / GS-15) TaxID=269799 RepID=Q39QG2_GEOMG|nr:hypothetical protein [Geobacter metallireducens]ABB33512.1 hypothetical protein Gmet_3299 [Geobacter metallireducens GS-15]EHP87619.1 hypothetical protein GeomeDRAFT_1143 [Geobacter metallireducens RCH3]